MRTTILASLVLNLIAGFAIAGEPTPEALLPVHDGKDAYTPCAAFAKDVFLVAWQSGRLAEGDLRQGLAGAGDIVGCRVDKSGKALDAAPFVVSAAADLQERPMAASNGDVFLVVWQDLRNGKDYDTYAARVSPEGKVLDPEGIAVSALPHNQANPRVAWDGKTFVVVWQDFRSDKAYEIYGARVSAEGKVLDAEGVLIASGKSQQRHCPAVASTGDGRSLVVAGGLPPGSGGVTAIGAIFADGKVVGGECFTSRDQREHGPGNRSTPIALAGGPQGYLSTWTTDHAISRGHSHGASSAAVFGPDGRLVKHLFMAGKEHRVLNPEVAWDGSAFVCAWAEWVGDARSKVPQHDQVFASRVSPAGEPSGLVHISGSFESPASEPCVASGDGSSLIAYEKHPDKPDVPIKIGFRLLTTR